MITNQLPSKAILDLARKIEYEKTQNFSPSYKQPAMEYQMMALLVWLDEYTKPRQGDLNLPIIQLDDDRK